MPAPTPPRPTPPPSTPSREAEARRTGTASSTSYYTKLQDNIKQYVVWGIILLLVFWQLPLIFSLPGKVRQAKQEEKKGLSQQVTPTKFVEVPWQQTGLYRQVVTLARRGDTSRWLDIPVYFTAHHSASQTGAVPTKYRLINNNNEQLALQSGARQPNLGTASQIQFTLDSEEPAVITVWFVRNN